MCSCAKWSPEALGFCVNPESIMNKNRNLIYRQLNDIIMQQRLV